MMSDTSFNADWRREIKAGMDCLERGDIDRLTKIIDLDVSRHVCKRVTSYTEAARTKLCRRIYQWICSEEICITNDTLVEFARVLRFHPKLSFMNLAKLLVLNTGDPELADKLDMGYEFLKNAYGALKGQKKIILLMKMIKGSKGRMTVQEKNHFQRLSQMETILLLNPSECADVFTWITEAFFSRELIDELQLANVVVSLFSCRGSPIIFPMIMQLPQNHYDLLGQLVSQNASDRVSAFGKSSIILDEDDGEEEALWCEESVPNLIRGSRVEWCNIVHALAPMMLPVQITMDIADWCVLIFTTVLDKTKPMWRRSDHKLEFTLMKRNIAAQKYRNSYAKLLESNIGIASSEQHTQKKRRTGASDDD